MDSKWQYGAFIYSGNTLTSDSMADSDYTSLSEQLQTHAKSRHDKFSGMEAKYSRNLGYMRNIIKFYSYSDGCFSSKDNVQLYFNTYF